MNEVLAIGPVMLLVSVIAGAMADPSSRNGRNLEPVLRLAVLVLLVVGSLLWLAPVARGQAGNDRNLQEDVAFGRELYLEHCAACHGVEARGTELGPDLVGVGAASADFYLRTGRMPAADSIGQQLSKEVAFNDAEILALVRYVDSLGTGPPIPQVDLSDTNPSDGQQLFIENCAACHGATGSGGAVGKEATAPGLRSPTPTQIAEAVTIGPGQMPVFTFPDEDLNDLVAHVRYLATQKHPGGADIGSIGPVPEGWVAWFIGMFALLVIVLFIGRAKKRPPTEIEE
jgi:ubiquinol-cytochrome c reductase cytochrome c subunit